MKHYILSAILTTAALLPETMSAESEIEGTVGADVVTRYIWRGQELGDAAIQPSGSLEYKGLSLAAWGSFGFINKEDAREFDLTLSYATKGFSVGVTDYYFSSYGTENKYFDYRAHSTQHVWEAFIGYDFGPAAITWYTNFAGDDGVNKSDKRAYSSYVELSAPFTLATCDWSATVGIVPYATSFYGDANGFAVTHAAIKCTKDVALCKSFSLPLFAELSCNPSTRKAYIVAGFSVSLSSAK